MNLAQSRLSEQPEQRAWIKVTFSWAAGLILGLSLMLAFAAIAVLAFPGTGVIHIGPLVTNETILTLILVVEISLIALVPLVTAWRLRYCRVQLWRWGLAGLASLVAWFIGGWISGTLTRNFSAWLLRSNAVERQVHALPLAVAAACLLAVAWLGANSMLWSKWRGFLLGLAVGIGLATLNGIVNLRLVGGDSPFTLHNFWIVPPFIWVSAVYFIERAQGRADRTAFLVWLGVIGLMFVLPYLVIRFLR